MAPRASSLSPVEEACTHLGALSAALGGQSAVDFDPSSLAEARPVWPAWPQPALSSLVGPPPTVVKSLGLRWLHRFETTVGALNATIAAAGGPSGGPSGLSLLVERAALMGSHGWGTTSVGTSCRMVRCVDGWLAINLARPDDIAAVPALVADSLETLTDHEPGVWSLLDAAASRLSAGQLVESAGLLGIPVGLVPPASAAPTAIAPFSIQRSHAVRPPGEAMRVVDLSSLWAGPLCSWYLGRAGARVTKVESVNRPDGARQGTPDFYRRLNGEKAIVDLDLRDQRGLDALGKLIASADVVVEASRPRAMSQLGIDVDSFVAGGGIWCSITGYGRTGEAAHRVAFGDDAAAAGGLVTYVEDQPWFIGDAAADPITGATAALAVLTLWNRGVSGLVEVPMVAAVAALTDGVPVPSRLQ